jgi:UPF0042 nucleotide-binding protein
MKIISFGFNDLSNRPDARNTVLFDCRNLPMPRYGGCGLEKEVKDDILGQAEAEELVVNGVGVALAAHRDVAFGCMAGFQRSVAIAEEVASRVRDMGVEVELEHLSLDPIFLEGKP